MKTKDRSSSGFAMPAGTKYADSGFCSYCFLPLESLQPGGTGSRHKDSLIPYGRCPQAVKARVASVTILRIDGSTEEHALQKGPKLLLGIHALLKVICTDSVRLDDGRIMVVDDNGWEVDFKEVEPGHIVGTPIRALKPINKKATELYLRVCKPGTTHQIAGDVALVYDEDFA